MTTDILVRAETEFSAKVIIEISAMLGRRRLSQAALARLLDVKPMWVSDRMTGRVRLTVDDLGRIADALNAEIVDLLPQERRGVSSDGRTTSPYEPTVTGATPWPDHPIVAGAVSLSLPGMRRPSVPVQPSRMDLAERRTAPVGR